MYLDYSHASHCRWYRASASVLLHFFIKPIYIYIVKAHCTSSSCCSFMLSELIWVWSGMNFSAGIWQSGLWNQFCKNDVVAITHPWCYLAACCSTAALTLPFTARKAEARRSLNSSMAESQCSSRWILPHVLCVHLLAKDSAMLLSLCRAESKFSISRKTG